MRRKKQKKETKKEEEGEEVFWVPLSLFLSTRAKKRAEILHIFARVSIAGLWFHCEGSIW